MTLVRDMRERMRHVVVPVLCTAALVYFGYHAVQGERGLLSWLRLTQQIAVAEAELDILSAERRELEHRARLLRPEGLDPDLLDERARLILGLAHPNELIILYD